jgi:hypothetical protein
MNRKYDRAKQLMLLGCFALSGMLMLSSIVMHMEWFTAPPYGIKDPPAGWSVESDGKEFRWKDPSGFYYMTHSSYKDAVDWAWAHWEYRRKNRTDKWRPVK